MTRTLLIDGDILVYDVVHASMVDAELDGIHFNLCDEREAFQRVDHRLERWKGDLDADRFEIALSDPASNWRKAVYPGYKANRAKGRKPVGFFAIRDYMKRTYGAREVPTLEADDVLGIWQTQGRAEWGETVIVSTDKDMMTIPGLLFRPQNEEQGVVKIHPLEARYNHYLQTLTGDTVDDYPGCPGVGPVTARKVLGDDPVSARWHLVVAAYEKAGLTKEAALTQARIARILQKGDYNTKTQRVRLWLPPKTKRT